MEGCETIGARRDPDVFARLAEGEQEKNGARAIGFRNNVAGCVMHIMHRAINTRAHVRNRARNKLAQAVVNVTAPRVAFIGQALKPRRVVR